ncbi:hypothetical protein AEQU2_00243 [Aequorivita lipolytica]|nr:hypothetical protein AEQU2_00243 [Aequorivita lipolytica]
MGQKIHRPNCVRNILGCTNKAGLGKLTLCYNHLKTKINDTHV